MIKWLTAALAVVCLAASAQTTQPLSQPHVTFVDASGLPCSACQLFTYAAGTTTPLATYSNAGGTPNTNPIILDAAGGATVWLGSNSYKFVLETPLGATIWTTDQVSGWLNAVVGKYLPVTGGTLTGPLTGTTINASVNGVINVTNYGAVADCTRTGSNTLCTNSNTAFTNAVTAGFPAHQALYLPVNPSATGETTYYVCPAIDTKGLSIYAQPGGWGLGSTGGYAYPVNIRGCASNDVIHINPATAYPTATWEGFNVITDDSVDVSASNTTRRLGRQCHDVVANGTTIITSALQCKFQQGDVGQAITVGSLTGTVASVQSVNQATLSFSATSGTTVATYISVLGLSVTQNIGNCGVAIEDATGTSANLAPAVILRNVGFATTTNTGNHTCAWLTQGNAALYNSEFDYVNTAGSTFGFMFIPSASGATNGTIYAGLGDRNRWVHNWLNNNYPFLAYDGGLDSLIDTQINGEIYGPTILPFDGVRNVPESWDIDLPEVESNGQHCTVGSNWFRLSGVRHTANRLYGPFCPETTSFIWDAAYSQGNNVFLGSVNAVEVSGDQSFINFTGQLNSPASVSITGRGVRAMQCSAFSSFATTTPGRCAFYSQAPSRSAIAFDRRTDFGRDAGTDDLGYYFSDEDLWMWPTEIGCSTCGYGPPLVADSTARTGQTLDTTGSSAFFIDEVNGSSLTISSSTVAGQIPAKKMRVYVRHKASTSISGAYFTVGANGSASNLCVNNTIALTTAWSVDFCDIDATSYAGDNLEIQIGQSGNANHIYTDYVRILPYPEDTLIPVVNISTSGPVTVSYTGFYVNNAAGALTFNLPTIKASNVGQQFCFRNDTGKSGAITLQLPASTSVDAVGVLGTAAGTYVSGGALGDSSCVVAVSTTLYLAYPGSGTWTAN